MRKTREYAPYQCVAHRPSTPPTYRFLVGCPGSSVGSVMAAVSTEHDDCTDNNGASFTCRLIARAIVEGVETATHASRKNHPPDPERPARKASAPCSSTWRSSGRAQREEFAVLMGFRCGEGLRSRRGTDSSTRVWPPGLCCCGWCRWRDEQKGSMATIRPRTRETRRDCGRGYWNLSGDGDSGTAVDLQGEEKGGIPYVR